MVNLQSIKQSIIHTEYGLKKPQSLIVLIPGVSLIFQKIQVSHLLNTLNTSYQNRRLSDVINIINSPESSKLDSIYMWHALGSMTQIIYLLALTVLSPFFLVPMFFSIYELQLSHSGMTHRVIINNYGSQNAQLHSVR